ncbi:Coenzyme F420 hydrogenase/dehydrogenase, beta subunit C-terminal domain [Actinospongicola halichondriae]|uniref:Coenzyme F420 hydrogenase/dehydrogenase, beta subunit C-terminal domain n=1 Tax=Actinospongicola halichondriae TaxID=3236844 RepID=UPI003D52C76F
MKSEFVPGISNVVRDDMCIACGACVAACPSQAVIPSFDDRRGAHEVRIVDSAACASCPAPCDDVCPSLEVDLVDLLQSRVAVRRSGPVSSTWLAAVPRHRDNGVSSSGGVLRALIHRAIERGSPVVCLTRQGDDYGPELIEDLGDLGRVPGSIYHSVSFVRAIEVLRSAGRPCVLVATPCQLEGIAKFVRSVEPDLDSQIALRVGLICGWMYSRHALEAFAYHKQVDVSGGIDDATYRGEGEAGNLVITTQGERHEFDRRTFDGLGDRIDYQSSFSRYANRLRCRVCEDHVNVLADVAVGDAWLERKRGQKLSLVVVRSARGEAAIADLRAHEEVEMEAADAGDLVESQSTNLVEGIEARLFNEYLAGHGSTTPTFRFGDGEIESTGPTAIQRGAFRFELLMRGTLRGGRYRRFRRLYTARDVSSRFVRRMRRLAGREKPR